MLINRRPLSRARPDPRRRAPPPAGRLSQRAPQLGGGLGNKRADGNDWVEWRWRIDKHTRRHGTGTAAPFGRQLTAVLTLDGVHHQLTGVLEGTTLTT